MARHARLHDKGAAQNYGRRRGFPGHRGVDCLAGYYFSIDAVKRGRCSPLQTTPAQVPGITPECARYRSEVANVHER